MISHLNKTTASGNWVQFLPALLLLLGGLSMGPLSALQDDREAGSGQDAVPSESGTEPASDTAERVSAARQTRGEVLVLAIDSIIHPVAEEYLIETLDEAERVDAAVVVVELSTPGGILTSTRHMWSAMLETDVPVVVWVAPQGAQAASAGFFLLMAGDLAAMTSGSNTGAAHPVGGQGEEIEGTLGEKVEQDAAAAIRSLAERRGRDLDLAESAVIESRSFSAKEALEAGLIDLIADDLPTLLDEISGREVEKGGRTVVLRTAGASVRRVEMNPSQRVRSVLADPNIAYLLMSLGGLGLYFELSNPGAIFPGAIGLICLILGLYSLSVLPVNYAGLGLLALAAVLFLLEIKVQSMGLLSVGGVVALVLGSTMLIDSPDPALEVSRQLIAVFAVVALLVVGFLARLALRAQRGRVATGQEGLVNARGEARSEIAPRGKVEVRGEIWNAVASAPVGEGQRIEVVGVDGMTLEVRALD